jgi:hypothetical protein
LLLGKQKKNALSKTECGFSKQSQIVKKIGFLKLCDFFEKMSIFLKNQNLKKNVDFTIFSKKNQSNQ